MYEEYDIEVEWGKLEFYSFLLFFLNILFLQYFVYPLMIFSILFRIFSASNRMKGRSEQSFLSLSVLLLLLVLVFILLLLLVFLCSSSCSIVLFTPHSLPLPFSHILRLVVRGSSIHARMRS